MQLNSLFVWFACIFWEADHDTVILQETFNEMRFALPYFETHSPAGLYD